MPYLGNIIIFLKAKILGFLPFFTANLSAISWVDSEGPIKLYLDLDESWFGLGTVVPSVIHACWPGGRGKQSELRERTIWSRPLWILWRFPVTLQLAWFLLRLALSGNFSFALIINCKSLRSKDSSFFTFLWVMDEIIRSDCIIQNII